MSHKEISADADYEFTLSDEEWRARLSPEEYAILRNAATERAGTGELLEEWGDGLYSCRACGNELFKSGTKFEAHCGWPSFYESVRPDAVELLEDNSLGMTRTEVRCARCGSHLGHVFPDGFGTPTGNRYCMNSLSLSFSPDADDSPDSAISSTPATAADPAASATPAVGEA